MDKKEQIVLAEVLQVCATLNSITQRGHENLKRGLPAILTEEEQAHIVQVLQLLHCSIFELSTLILDGKNQAINQSQRPFLYLV